MPLISTRSDSELAKIRQEHFGPMDIGRFKDTKLGKDQPDWIWDFKHHHVVWIEAKVPKILIWSTAMHSQIDATNDNDFRDLFGAIKERGYAEILAICTVFQHMHPRLDLSLLIKKFLAGNVDDLLSRTLPETRGWLIYHEQVEKIFQMLTGSDLASARAFRKDLNLRASRARYIAAEIKIPGGSDLWTWLQLHLLSSDKLVYTPNHHGAFLLYGHLNKGI